MSEDITTLAELKSQSQGKSLVILDIWANWCPPCRNMLPIFKDLKREFSNPPTSFKNQANYDKSKNYQPVHFLKADTDVANDINDKYKVTAVPTFVIIKDGDIDNPVQRFVGGQTFKFIKDALISHM